MGSSERLINGLEAARNLDRRHPPPTVEKKLPFGLVLSEKMGFVNAYFNTLGRPTGDLMVPEKPNLVQKLMAFAVLKANLAHYAICIGKDPVHNVSAGGVFKW